jgi:alpha-mannosidase
VADQGRHRFAYAIVPGDIGNAVQEGYWLNLSERHIDGATPVAPLVTVDDPAVIVEAVKLADDRSGDVVVRIYESRGNRARATLHCALPIREAVITDLLERPLADGLALAPSGGSIELGLRPFQILTVRLCRDL